MDQAAVVSGHLSLGGFDAKMAQRMYTGVGILRVQNLGGMWLGVEDEQDRRVCESGHES